MRNLMTLQNFPNVIIVSLIVLAWTSLLSVLVGALF
jgi:hypothetical protein